MQQFSVTQKNLRKAKILRKETEEIITKEFNRTLQNKKLRGN